MRPMRGDIAGHRKRACAGGRKALGDAASRRPHSDRTLRPRRQGHVDSPEKYGAMSETAVKTPSERIVTALRAAAKQGQPALVAFLTAGYPSRAKFREHLSAIALEADVIEIGVPFSDPMADGVTIQRSSEAALREGVTLTWILEELQLMAPVQAPLLPLDERDELRAVLAPANLALVQMVTPVTPNERLVRLATASQGFVYAVT